MKKVILIFLVVSSLLTAKTIKEKEPNNFFSEATPISINEIGLGNVGQGYWRRGEYIGDDNDYWKFTPDQSGELEIYVITDEPWASALLYNNDKRLIGEELVPNINYYYYFFYFKQSVKAGETYYLDLYDDIGIPTDYEILFVFKPTSNITTDERPFTLRYHINTTGNYKMIGNTVLCYKKNGQCVNTSSPNNDLDLSYINVLNQNTISVNGKTVNVINSSKAEISGIPDDATILWVGFYTQGDWKNITLSDLEKKLKDNPSYLEAPNGDIYTIYPQQIDLYSFGDMKTFSTFSEVKQLEGKSGSYFNNWWTGINVQTGEGADRDLGYYGAWDLVVVYEDPQDHYKNISVFDGYRFVYDSRGHNDVTINVNGFLTPETGPVNSKMSVFVGEGDKAYAGDQLFFKSSSDKSYINVNEGTAEEDNAFDSTINGFQAIPYLYNDFGIDIHNYDIGSGGLNIIHNGDTSASIQMTSRGDAYFPSVVVFATDLYVPKVCYDNLEFYTKNGLVQPGGNIPVDSNITIKFNIKNLDYKTAKDVNVSYQFNDSLNYIPNSTFVQNVPDNENKLIHINDNSFSPYDYNLKVYYDKDTQKWKVGIIGDKNNEFLSTLNNPNYVATVELNATVKKEGNIAFNFKTSYNYYIGDKEYTYNDSYLPKCSDFNAYLDVYNPNIGTFNVVEPTFDQTIDPQSSSVNDIYTKIVNKPFSVKILHLGSDYETLKGYKGDVTLQVIPITDTNTSYDCQNATAIWSKYNIPFNGESSVSVTGINIPMALRNAAFRIIYTDNGKTYKVCSRDNFAVKPYKFVFSKYPKTPIKAGEDFNVTVEAVGYDNKPAKGYDQTINIRGTSPDLNYTEIKNGCITGVLKPISSLKFVNGEANLTLSYSEVGDLNLSIKELLGSEFALVDAKQETSNKLLISPASKILSFIPYKFVVSGYYGNFGIKQASAKVVNETSTTSVSSVTDNSPFTYISNDLNMSSILYLNIKAVNKQGVQTKNYNYQCYAQNLDINISHTVPSNEKIIIYNEKNLNSKDKNVSVNDDITFSKLFKNYFVPSNGGEANLTIEINFPKSYDKPVNTFDFTVKDVNITDSNGTLGKVTIDQSAQFRYGRILMKDVNSLPNSKSVNTTFKYEYWTANGWVLNKDHVRADGDINLSQVIVAANGVKPLSNSDISVQVIPQSGKYILNGIENVQISTTHALPYSAKLHFGIPSWLWYYPLATKYEAPSLKNLNCLTHPCMKVTFISNGQGWAGIGSASSKYSESNMTVKVKMKSDVNATKGQVKKINW